MCVTLTHAHSHSRLGPQEGICTDAATAKDLAPLLRAESSQLPAGTLTSFEEYVARADARAAKSSGGSDDAASSSASSASGKKKHIYYLIAPSRAAAMSSAYMEGFRRKNIEGTSEMRAVGETHTSRGVDA